MSRTVNLAACVMCEYHIGVTTLEDCRRRSNFCPDRGSHPRRWGTSAPEAKVLTTGPPVVPYASRFGAGLYSTPFLFSTYMPNILQYPVGNQIINIAAKKGKEETSVHKACPNMVIVCLIINEDALALPFSFLYVCYFTYLLYLSEKAVFILPNTNYCYTCFYLELKVRKLENISESTERI